MSLHPWQTFRLKLPRNPVDVVRELAESIPPCRSWNTSSYFCGTVDVAAGRFALYRSGLPRGRMWSPVLHGTLKPGDPGTLLEVSIAPAIGVWLSLLVPSVPVLFVFLWLFTWILDGPVTGHPLLVCFFSVFGVLTTSWIWGTAILVHYLHMPKYRKEFTRLVSGAIEEGVKQSGQ